MRDDSARRRTWGHWLLVGLCLTGALPLAALRDAGMGASRLLPRKFASLPLPSQSPAPEEEERSAGESARDALPHAAVRRLGRGRPGARPHESAAPSAGRPQPGHFANRLTSGPSRALDYHRGAGAYLRC